jgi:hypothetical protein
MFLGAVPFFATYIYPQIAGVLGGIAYLIVRHELKMASLSFKSGFIVMFFGWLGAWATVNVIAADFVNLANVYTQILSASAGFLMYDAMLALGANTTSVVGFIADMIKKIINKVIDKWNS